MGGVAATVVALGVVYNFIPQGMHLVFWSDLQGMQSQQQLIVENQQYFKIEFDLGRISDLKFERRQLEQHMAEFSNQTETVRLDKARIAEIDREIRKLEARIDRNEARLEELEGGS
ncbi:MAG: hypothetical protein V3S69_04910 [Dehalococcoidales bacterium]